MDRLEALEREVAELKRAVEVLLHPIRGAQVVEGSGPVDSGAGGDVRDTSPGTGDSGATPGTGVVTADPVNLFNGMMWVRSDVHQMRWSEGGTKYQVTGTAV